MGMARAEGRRPDSNTTSPDRRSQARAAMASAGNSSFSGSGSMSGSGGDLSLLKHRLPERQTTSERRGSPDRLGSQQMQMISQMAMNVGPGGNAARVALRDP